MLIRVIKPDGSTTTTVYDDAHRIISTVEKTTSNIVISGFEYTYDSLGRILTERELANNVNKSYTYDSTSRVTKCTITDLTNNTSTEQNFSYDLAGNELNNNTFTYDSNNRLISQNGHQISYDADGNMSYAFIGNTTLDFAYDSANRLISAGTTTYTYDAQDIRIKAVCGNTTNLYVYDTNA